MRKFFYLIILLSFIISCTAYRVIIPVINEAPRTSITLNKPILFSILDARVRKDKSIEIINSIRKGLENTYGNSLKWIDYFEKIPKNNIAIKIRLKANGANFGSRLISVPYIKNTFSALIASVSTKWSNVIVAASHQQTTLESAFYAEGWWIGTSWLEISISDNLSGKLEKMTFPIVSEHKESNMFGYKSAKIALNRSWNIVSQHLIQVLDNTLTSMRDKGY